MKFEVEANNMQLVKEDTQRSTLNGKYLSLAPVFHVLIILFVFIAFNICKVRFYFTIRSPTKRSWSV